MRSLTRRAALLTHLGVEFVAGVREHLKRREDGSGSLVRRLGEQGILLGLNAISATDYYAYGLQRRSLAWARKREFVGSVEQWRWLEPFNPARYRFFTEDKVLFKRFLANAGVPVPRLLGVLGRDGRAETGHPLRTAAERANWLAAPSIEHVVIKPVRGSRGTGVLVLGARHPGGDGWERVPSGLVRVEDIETHLESYGHRGELLCEERLRPHRELAAFSPDVAHSARIVTVIDEGFEVLGAALRIGSGATAVDNFSQGNLAAPVDPATGRLGAAVFSRARSLSRVSTHPVTAAPIEGRVLPDWASALEVLERAATAIPFSRMLGWDLAFTDRGPVVIEANDLWDPDVTQIAPDCGLLATGLRFHLERHDALGLIGLGWGPVRRTRG